MDEDGVVCQDDGASIWCVQGQAVIDVAKHENEFVTPEYSYSIYR